MSAADAKRAGIFFYELPEVLNYDGVDPLLRETVHLINRSGWVWTTESCQGHPDAEHYMPWASNTRPYLNLVCVSARFGAMLDRLMRASRWIDCDTGLERWVGLETWVTRVVADYAQMGVYVKATTVFERNQGVQLFKRFADALQERA